MSATIVSIHMEPWNRTRVKKEVSTLTEFIFEVRRLREDHIPNIEIFHDGKTVGEWTWDCDIDYDEDGPYELDGGSYVLTRPKHTT